MISYLEREAVDATLSFYAAASAPGSRLAFTYVDRRILDEYRSGGGDPKWISAVRRGGEPFKLALDPTRSRTELAELGYELLEDDSTAAEEETGGAAEAGRGLPAVLPRRPRRGFLESGRRDRDRLVAAEALAADERAPGLELERVGDRGPLHPARGSA